MQTTGRFRERTRGSTNSGERPTHAEGTAPILAGGSNRGSNAPETGTDPSERPGTSLPKTLEKQRIRSHRWMTADPGVELMGLEPTTPCLQKILEA